MMGDGSWLAGVGFALFLVAFIAGVVMAMASLFSRSSPSGLSTLRDRYACGELSTEEYRERLDVLEQSRPLSRHRSRLVIATGLIVAGLIGSVVIAANFDHSFMDMGSMMGMMGGNSGRDGGAPREGAPEEVVVAADFSFAPSTITVAAGEPVNLVLQNDGSIFHTLTIAELDFELRANAGDEIGGAVTPPQPGRYEFVCSVPGHASQGMRGTLVVQANG